MKFKDRTTRTRNLDLGRKICDLGLSFILHAVWTFHAPTNFVIHKYSLRINIDININIFVKKAVF